MLEFERQQSPFITILPKKQPKNLPTVFIIVLKYEAIKWVDSATLFFKTGKGSKKSLDQN